MKRKLPSSPNRVIQLRETARKPHQPENEKQSLLSIFLISATASHNRSLSCVSLGEYQSPGKDRVEMAEKSKKAPKKTPKQMPRQQQQQRQEQGLAQGANSGGRRGDKSEMPDRRGEQDRRNQ
ncbi:hypothetical protein ACL02S_09480 [Nocardia sp. 004]|uniref:hypothetical protein n=1 Tax=Nocardia sp. 004 TaxID=3385978 RepID=UPI0039A3EB03